MQMVIQTSGCKVNKSKSDESLSAGNQISVSEIKAATFIDLSFEKFPTLPVISIETGNVLYVSGSGSDENGSGSIGSPFKTIAKAVSMAVSGDKIAVYGGDYYEESSPGDYRAVVIDKTGLLITSVNGDAVRILPANKAVTYGIEVNSSGTVINGITLQGFEQGILYSDKTINNSVVSNCTISDVSEGIATWNGTLKGLLLYNVKIINAALIGIHCGNGYGYDWRVENCSVKMKNRSNSSSGADSFAIEHGDNILILSSSFSGAAADGIDTKATRVVIFNSIVNNVQRNGIKLWHGGDIINCLVHHTGADASIVVEKGPKVRILNSTVGFHNFNGSTSYNMTFGYDSGDHIEIEIVNSIFFNTSGGSYINPQSNLKINNSLFFNMENGKILDYGTITVFLSQGRDGLTSFGSGNIVSDPLLDSFFHTLSGSPVINSGIKSENYFPLHDMLGNPRIKNGKPDLGPFEDF